MSKLLWVIMENILLTESTDMIVLEITSRAWSSFFITGFIALFKVSSDRSLVLHSLFGDIYSSEHRWGSGDGCVLNRSINFMNSIWSRANSGFGKRLFDGVNSLCFVNEHIWGSWLVILINLLWIIRTRTNYTSIVFETSNFGHKEWIILLIGPNNCVEKLIALVFFMQIKFENWC